MNQCAADGSRSNESILYIRVVKRNLVNKSSLLSEEAERGSFRLHSLIREYVRLNAGASARLYQDIALRAVHGAIEEEVVQASTFDSLSIVTKRAVVALASHAVAVVVDQVDGREPGEAEEDKFLEVTEHWRVSQFMR